MFSIERTENARYLERKEDTGKEKEKTEQKKEKKRSFQCRQAYTYPYITCIFTL